MKVLYCPLCERNVQLKKHFSWPIFLLGLLLFGVGAVVYILWYIIKPGDACPICGGKRFMKARVKKKPVVKPKPKEITKEAETV